MNSRQSRSRPGLRLTIAIMLALGGSSARLSFAQGVTESKVREPILVKARVKETRPSAGAVVGVLEIVHVYSGPKSLLGRSFLDYSVNQGNAALYAIPDFEKGEIGIWSLCDTKDGLKPSLDDNLGFLTRCRQKWDAQAYPYFEALAEAVGQVFKAVGADTQVQLLKDHVLAQKPLISVWAVRTLADREPEGIEQWFEKLFLDKMFSVHGQIAIDRVFLDSRGKPWQSSKVRREVMEQWVAERLDEPNSVAILAALDGYAQRGQISDELLLKLLATAANNDALAKAFKNGADIGTWLVQQISKRVKNQELAFDFLTEQVKSAKFARIRLAAANGFTRFDSLTDNQIARLRALRLETKEQSIIDVLEKTLIRFEKPNPAVNRPVLTAISMRAQADTWRTENQ